MTHVSAICQNKYAVVRNFSCTHNLLKANFNNLIKESKSNKITQKVIDEQKNVKNQCRVQPKSALDLLNFEPKDNTISENIPDNSSPSTDSEISHPEEHQPANPFIICFPDNAYYPPKAEPEQTNPQQINSHLQISNPPLQTQLAPPPSLPSQQQQHLPPQNVECINNYYPITKKRTRTPFTKEEDDKLKELVQLYSCIEDKSKWYFIANQIPDRSARQCRERFQLFLCDGIRRKEKWTKEEDELLLTKYSIIGPHWKSMEKFFVGRTSYAIKNRYISLNRQKKHFNSGSSDENSNDYSSNDNGINTGNQNNSEIKNVALTVSNLINSK